MTHQDFRPLFEDPSASSELRNFVALARGDGPSQADLERLAGRVGRAVGVSAGVLLVSSTARATALGTPPAELAAALEPGLSGKLGVLGKLFASSGAKLMAVGLSAGIGIGLWTYARPQPPARDASAQLANRAPELVEPAATPQAPAGSHASGPTQQAAAQPAEARSTPVAPVPVVTALPSDPIRGSRARSAASRALGRRKSASELAAPVNEEPGPAEPLAPQPPAAELPSELSLIQQAEATRHRGAQALRLLATHERLYPGGALAQEREVLAIELLFKIGKSQQARERAARFERSHPSSAHMPKVRALLERGSDE